MSATSDESNAGQSSGQAGETDSLDIDGGKAMKGRERPQASGPEERIAEPLRATAQGHAASDRLVADQALAPSEQKLQVAKVSKLHRQPNELMRAITRCAPREVPPSSAARSHRLKIASMSNGSG